ncbi:MAG: phage major capsid protein [Alphaproteobacteria bacterium]
MQTRDVKAAVDALATAFEEFKRANDEALRQKADKGAADAMTEAKLARLDGEIERLRDDLDRARASLNRPARGAAGAAVESPRETEHKAAFRAYLCKGDDSALAGLERKALSVGADPEGGYLVTPAMSERIVGTVFETSPVRRVAAVETISSDSLEMLVDKDDAAAGWVAEAEARPETATPDLAKINIPVHEIYAEPRATQKLVDDASIDVETWLAGKVAGKFARMEATAFVNGAGVGQPRGFLTYPAGVAWGEIEQINSGAPGAVAADGAVDLAHALKEEYGANAVWLVNRLTLRDLRKLKDANNQYLWQPGLGAGVQDTLLGRPIHVASDMPAPAAGSLSIAFGDFARGYQIVDRIGIRVLRDPFTAKPYVKFYTTKRVGGDVVNFEAIKLQKLAA